ncbi:hypothetical protein GLOTRDRAFT_130130 [Gloeophyllum trabeum ATCC 11539]|uniref:Uncharacterized protein n=1 Tax=Gloeophyllum trabeum (strain ATCC 11539 / FP-39264 / Madison 617) TaxID=670483 RepID=S7Q5L2_GLOTA|nr:uncharacterized protein GLOTRDRAFT_130130 [Gloeophyllum trabeum ATCC 11539]EPQ54777.1 hypothetical protein GLOTRDRAFT_130130 [Gloeophyllum trabeum ATCC 11539]
MLNNMCNTFGLPPESLPGAPVAVVREGQQPRSREEKFKLWGGSAGNRGAAQATVF